MPLPPESENVIESPATIVGLSGAITTVGCGSVGDAGLCPPELLGDDVEDEPPPPFDPQPNAIKDASRTKMIRVPPTCRILGPNGVSLIIGESPDEQYCGPKDLGHL